MSRRNNKSSLWVWAIALIIVGSLFAYTKYSDKSYTKLSDSRELTESEKTVNSPNADGTVKTQSEQGLELPSINSDGQLLKRTAYTVLYDSPTRLPIWVAWRLTADHVDGDYSRNGLKFAEDTDVPEPRATNDDYRNSGYDRGHLCPSGDNKWSSEAQLQSFLYTNCCPQTHSLNAGDWNELEQRCRKWASEYGEIFIVSGPILTEGVKHKTIGKHKVVVPERFFKVVLCMGDSPKAIGFICDNGDQNLSLADYVVTVDEVESVTGLDFFPTLPDDVENAVEATASLSDW